MPPDTRRAKARTPANVTVSDQARGTNDYSIYPHMDALRSSAPWRLADYDESGALSDEDLSGLARRFDLPPGIPQQLSVEVGNCLDVGSHVVLVEVTRAEAIQRAERLLKRALPWARRAKGRAIIRDALAPLEPAFASDEAEAAVLRSAKERANDEVTPISELVAAGKRVLETPGCAADMSPRDHRRVWDKRREYVVQSCCYAWRDAGRSLTYTTVSDKSKIGQRHGPLIEFIQAVVGMVTQSPSELSGETIRKDIDRFRELLKDPDGTLGEPEFGRP